MRYINKNLKAILTLCAALTVPAVLPADTSFASVSAVESQSKIGVTEALNSIEAEDSLMGSEQLCVNSYLGRDKLKELLHNNMKKVTLTFDDGPNPCTTPLILDILKKRNIKACFFVLGLQAKKHPEIVKRIHDEGHFVGNHTYHHKNLAKLKPEEIKKELESASALIESITGVRPKYMRPPYGSNSKKVISAAKEAGMDVVLWTVDTRDWKSRNEVAVLGEVSKQLGISKGNMHGGAVLMHDIYPSTVRSLDMVLDKLAVNEFKVAALDKLGNTASDFWAAKAPAVITTPMGPKHFDLNLSGNQIMIAYFKEKPQKKLSHSAMLKARQEGKLLVYLAKNS